MEIHVSPDKCMGNGLCVDAAPAVFVVETDCVAHVVEPAYEAHRLEVDHAITLCPTQAITLRP